MSNSVLRSTECSIQSVPLTDYTISTKIKDSRLVERERDRHGEREG